MHTFHACFPWEHDLPRVTHGRTCISCNIPAVSVRVLHFDQMAQKNSFPVPFQGFGRRNGAVPRFASDSGFNGSFGRLTDTASC